MITLIIKQSLVVGCEAAEWGLALHDQPVGYWRRGQPGGAVLYNLYEGGFWEWSLGWCMKLLKLISVQNLPLLLLEWSTAQRHRTATYLALKNKLVSVDHYTCNLWWTNHLHHLRMVDLYHFPCIPTCSQLSSSWGAFEKELHNLSAWLPAAGIMPNMPISPRIKPTNKGIASTWSRLELESLVRTAFFRQTF